MLEGMTLDQASAKPGKQRLTRPADPAGKRRARTGSQGALKSASMNELTSDEELMCRYRDGDPRAFEALYARHKGGLFRYFFRQCSDQAIAEELYQDVWTRVITSRDRYQPTAKFTTWIYRIAHNRLIDHYRQSSRQVPRSFEEEDAPDFQAAPDHHDPAHYAAVLRDAEKLIEVVEMLPEAQKESFLLKTEGGLSLEEIAETTGVNRETAKSRLRYAMNKIRRAMES